jgi:hypothetical protein
MRSARRSEGCVFLSADAAAAHLVATAAAQVWQKAQAGPANSRAVRGDWLSDWLSTRFHDRVCEAKGARNFKEVGAGDPT